MSNLRACAWIHGCMSLDAATLIGNVNSPLPEITNAFVFPTARLAEVPHGALLGLS